MSKLHFQVPSSIFISPWSTSLHDIAVCDNAVSQADPYQSRMEKKLHFWDSHSLLYLPFQLSRLEDSFLCLNPLSFLNHSKSKHFRLIPTIFLWLLGILLHSYIVFPVLCCTFHEFLKAYLKRHSVESIVLTGEEFFFYQLEQSDIEFSTLCW